MPKITVSYGGSYQGNSPKNELPSTHDMPPTQPRSKFTSDRVHHIHADPIGVNPADYPQIQPNRQQMKDTVRYGAAIPKELHHGSASLGGPAGDARNCSAAGEPKSAPMPRHVPDSSYSGAGYGRPDSMKRRGVSG